MPIPFVIMGIIAGSAALGAGKTVKAGIDTKKAGNINSMSKNIVDNSIETANKAREYCGDAIRNLGEQKIYTLNNSISRFIKTFEKIHNIELKESIGLNELNTFKLDEVSFSELKKLEGYSKSLTAGVAGGSLAGAVTAFGAYQGAMVIGTASTGTAISTLSGAAATKATLAFFGGGALKAGGLGIAGGTTILGGLVAAPALAIFGVVVGAKANANKERAYENLAKAKEFEEEMKTIKTICTGIRLRANLFDRLLIKLSCHFDPLVLELEKLVQKSGTDFSEYSEEDKSLVGKIMAVAGAIKAVIDTPILNEEGGLRDESLVISDSANRLLQKD